MADYVYKSPWVRDPKTGQFRAPAWKRTQGVQGKETGDFQRYGDYETAPRMAPVEGRRDTGGPVKSYGVDEGD